MTSQRPPPSFTGLVIHREPRYGFSFLIPEGWHYHELLSDVGGGAIYAPDPDDLTTSFSAEGRDLGFEVEPPDLGSLRSGFLAGVRKMPRSLVESHEAEVVGRLITMEARHTYREGDAVRKRWVRLLYQGRIQVRLIAQGSDADEFAHWEPMFFQTMRTFRFGDWWAEINGTPWAERAFPTDPLAERSES